MNFLACVVIISAVFNVVVGCLVFFKNPRRFVSKSFFVFTLGTALWSGGFLALSLSHSFIFTQIIILGTILGVGGLYVFTHYFPGNISEKVSTSTYLNLSPLFLLALCIPLKLIITGNHYLSNSELPVPDGGPLFPIFVALIAIYLCASIYHLVLAYTRSNLLEKNKVFYFILGLGSFLFLSLIFSLLLPYLGIEHLNYIGFISSSLFVVSTGYTLIAKQLLDVKVVIQRIVIYLFLLSVITALYLVLLFTLHYHLGEQNQTSIFFAGILTIIIGFTTLPHIDRLLRRLMDRWFFVHTYDSNSFLVEFSQKISLTESISETVEYVVHEVGEVLRSQGVTLIIAEQKTGVSNNEIYYQGRGGKLFVPVIYRSHYIATLIISPKKSGERYRTQDLELLNILSYQVASKLRQLLLLEELKRYSHHLEGALEESQSDKEDILEHQDAMILDIAHNLQTPLTVLRGEVQLLTTTQKELTAENLDHLTESIDRFSQFVTKLLKVGDSDQYRYHLVEQDVSTIVENIVEYLTTITEEKGVILTSSLEDGIVGKVDAHAFEEMVVNVASNGIKYGKDEGEQRVSITLSSHDENYILEVSDNGIGMSPEQQNQVFKRWYRGNTQTKGSGLGLAIVQRIATAHGAKVELSSEEGQGTTVRIIFPRS